MPWSYYRENLKAVSDSARPIILDGLYKPVAVIGITNGGAMFADLLGRELFGGNVPIASLWAQRSEPSAYFDNQINLATIQGVKELTKNVSEPSVLLVDDIVASGTTLHQALGFLKKHIKGVDIRFLPLFSRNEKYFDMVKENLLWRHSAFKISEKDIMNLRSTTWSRLPYDKDIRSS